MNDRISVKRATEDGILIALSAARMAVKNRIIVGALRDHNDYDQAEYAATAKAELSKLARQNENDAKRIVRALENLQAAELTRKPSENRRGDIKQFGKREKIYKGVAKALKAAAKDEEQLATIVSAAQQDAADEVRDALTARLRRRPHKADANYEKLKPERVKALLTIDLAGLERQQTSSVEDGWISTVWRRFRH